MANVRTPAEVRQEFARRGLSIASWARAHGFFAPLVYQVLSQKKLATRGECHRIAVALTLKDGEVGDLEDLPFGRPSRAVDYSGPRKP